MSGPALLRETAARLAAAGLPDPQADAQRKTERATAGFAAIKALLDA